MEKCNKCGNRLSHLDVLCPQCYALVEKVQSLAVVPEELRTAGLSSEEKHIPKPADASGEIQHRHMPKPSSSPDTEPPKILMNPQPGSQHAANSYAGSSKPAPLGPAIFSGRTPSAIHGASSGSMPEDNLSFTGGESKDTPPPESLTPKPESGRKNWLEIAELPEQTYRRSAVTADKYRHQQTQPDYSEKRYTRRTFDKNAKDAAASHEKRPVFLTVVIWLLAAGVLFGVFHFLSRYIISTYGSFDAFLREVTAGKIELDTNAAAADSIIINISEAENELGDPAHIFEISAYKGESVRLLPINQTFQMNNGHAAFIVSDKDLARTLGIVTSEDVYESDNISLIINTGVQEVTRSAGNITLKMTPAPYSRSMPQFNSSQTQSDTANIVISVDKDAKVYINQNDYSSHIDEKGRLSLILPLEPGENYFKIDVCQIGYKTIQDSFVINREAD